MGTHAWTSWRVRFPSTNDALIHRIRNCQVEAKIVFEGLVFLMPHLDLNDKYEEIFAELDKLEAARQHDGFSELITKAREIISDKQNVIETAGQTVQLIEKINAE